MKPNKSVSDLLEKSSEPTISEYKINLKEIEP